MRYSLDFKPRFLFGILDNSEENKDNTLYFNFYDYDKHKDIRCYEKDGETEVPAATVSHVLNKFCTEDKTDFVYDIRFIKLAEDLGEVWSAQAIHKSGHLVFFGYSQFSAHHAIEDLEQAKRIILRRYFNPVEAVKIQEAYRLELQKRAEAKIAAETAEFVEDEPEEEKVEEVTEETAKEKE